MPYYFIIKFLKAFSIMAFAAFLGVLSFHLFHLSERAQMLRLAEEYHQAQINNDKETIDRLLAPDFSETGYRIFVQTPETTFKKDVLGLDYPILGRIHIDIEYPLLLNLLNNDTASVSFIRTHRFDREKKSPFSSLSFHVTYTFARYADGWKIKHIERNFLIPWGKE